VIPFSQIRPISCLITSGTLTSEEFEQKSEQVLDAIRAGADAGVGLVQIREKALTARQIFRLVEESLKRVSRTDCLVLVNERADIALAAGAHGVHLTSTSIPPARVREFAPAKFVIGVSTHTVPEVLRARDAGADFVVFGPVFPTPGKADLQGAKGLDELSLVCKAAAGFPVLALGGIDSSNYREALDAGASGIAAIRLFSDLEKAEHVIRGLSALHIKGDPA
jgi:thiamine-phosphate diphosphorylase